MKIGYVRVSTADQNEARQIKAMREDGVEKIYMDKQSGKQRRGLMVLQMVSPSRRANLCLGNSISDLDSAGSGKCSYLNSPLFLHKISPIFL